MGQASFAVVERQPGAHQPEQGYSFGSLRRIGNPASTGPETRCSKQLFKEPPTITFGEPRRGDFQCAR